VRLAHLIALYDVNFNIVCSDCRSDRPCNSLHRTENLRRLAVEYAQTWRRHYRAQAGHWRNDTGYAWPQNDEEAAMVPVLAPLDTFDPKATNVRCITLDQWHSEVGETPFRLATDAGSVVV
jgi:hypothetical protein